MKIVLCGGGTAGHITPAIAIAESLSKKRKNTQFLFIGREGGDENLAVEKAGLDYKTLKIRGLERKLSINNIRNATLAISAEIKAAKILKEFAPDAVIGTGGYVCWPVLHAAARLKIPTAIHESNLYPGLVTRILCKKCDITFLNLKGTLEYVKAKNAKTVGNPLRIDFSSIKRVTARKKLGASDTDTVIVSFGGSLGAEKMNDTIVEVMKAPDLLHRSIIHVHATGKRYYDRYKNSLRSSSGSSRRIVPYIDDMPMHLIAADIVICRCGAMTISEISMAGAAAILVPSPNVTDNHQYKNGKHLAENGAALMIEEKNLTAEELKKAIIGIMDNKRKRERMQAKIKSFSTPEAKDLISNEILRLIESK